MSALRRVFMLAFPGCQILDAVGPMQMFAGANAGRDPAPYALTLAAPAAGPFDTNSGLRLVADRDFARLLSERFGPDDTVIAAGGDKGLRAALAKGTIPRIAAAAHQAGARVVSVCSGAFFLAAAGLLDGRRATTHWNAIGRLRRFRPAVTVDPDAIYVRDGDIWTSAGVTAGIDLALALIEADLGRAAALSVARDHVVFPIRPGGQSQFSAALAAGGARDPRLARLARGIAARPNEDWTAERLAAEAAVSPRTLTRLFRRELDTSPIGFVERVRVDRARQALLRTGGTIERIAHDCGFGSHRRMDRAFARAIGVTPVDYRSRFKTKGDASWLASTLAS